MRNKCGGQRKCLTVQLNSRLMRIELYTKVCTDMVHGHMFVTSSMSMCKYSCPPHKFENLYIYLFVNYYAICIMNIYEI